eukprot:TRINITY_DN2466_c0_g4_i1.p1 TRINITY_DN2466_c0_g4~~TRINITY_DN2466_c0_g4_i1.p1  ORF type:complete len:379 (+),score=76.02 TRINITY_DN2466_c0_g4_i1:26-1162(+)
MKQEEDVDDLDFNTLLESAYTVSENDYIHRYFQNDKSFEGMELDDRDLPQSMQNVSSQRKRCIFLLGDMLDFFVIFGNRTSIMSELVQSSTLLFCTLSISGRYDVKNAGYEYLIIDEAGQAKEPECMIPFHAKPKHCLLVGDPNQLPGFINSNVARKCKYNRSTIERLITNEHPYIMLDEQYRMHPIISKWSMNHFYEGISDAQITNSIRSTICKPLSFIQVSSLEQTANRTSKKNIHEAGIVANIIEILLTKDIVMDREGKEFGVITFYDAQVQEIKDRLNYTGLDIEVETVDSYQGGERDYIILSFVRSNNEYGGNPVGFVNDFRRLNVSLTRARISLIMVGNSDTLRRGGEDLHKMVVYLEENGHIVDNIDDIFI